MILRLRQLCCHPNLILVSILFVDDFRLVTHCLASLGGVQCQAEDYDDPTLLMSGESEKELARAKRVMGLEWVGKLKRR